MSAGPATDLRLERTFAASPEDVFDAWTSPEVLTRWWAAQPTWTSPGCEVDLRVGGRYVLRMRNDETGDVYAVGGEYREVDRPRRLVYTWRWEGDDGPVSVVTVEFVATGEATTVRLEHTGLPSAESATRHTAGWTGTLDNLGRRVFGG
ncbi:MAG TPA: SRPBCC domain-containing protein [Solirubrobacteraceae bacterium]